MVSMAHLHLQIYKPKQQKVVKIFKAKKTLNRKTKLIFDSHCISHQRTFCQYSAN